MLCWIVCAGIHRVVYIHGKWQNYIHWRNVFLIDELIAYCCSLVMVRIFTCKEIMVIVNTHLWLTADWPTFLIRVGCVSWWIDNRNSRDKEITALDCNIKRVLYGLVVSCYGLWHYICKLHGRYSQKSLPKPTQTLDMQLVEKAISTNHMQDIGGSVIFRIPAMCHGFSVPVTNKFILCICKINTSSNKKYIIPPQEARDVDQTLDKCWACVE